MECERVRHLVVAAAICESLHHHHHLGLFFQLAAIIVEVFYKVVEVNLEHRLMRFLLQHLHDALKFEASCAFEQNYLIFK